MKDYIMVAGQLGVSHLLVLSQTNKNVILRIGKCTQGPTLHFKVLKYSLCNQVRSSQRRPYDSTTGYLSPPLIVLNNFNQSEESHVKLLKVTFQNMFPTINVKTVKLGECRRVVLFHYNKEGEQPNFIYFLILSYLILSYLIVSYLIFILSLSDLI